MINQQGDIENITYGVFVLEQVLRKRLRRGKLILSLRCNQQYSGVVQMCKGLDNNATLLIYQTVQGALHLYRVYTVQAWMWEGGSRITYSA